METEIEKLKIILCENFSWKHFVCLTCVPFPCSLRYIWLVILHVSQVNALLYRYFKCHFRQEHNKLIIINSKIVKLAKVQIRPNYKLNWRWNLLTVLTWINFTVVSGLIWTFVGFIIWNVSEGQYSMINNSNDMRSC